MTWGGLILIGLAVLLLLLRSKGGG